MSATDLQIHERAVGDVAILDVIGRMVLSERSSDVLFRGTITDLLSVGRRHLILNLSQVSQVDTSGITALVTAHLTTSKRGGALKLVSPTKRVRDLLGITRLNTLFDVYDTEDAAIASFE
jgi:anti-anti-sigma factor